MQLLTMAEQILKELKPLGYVQLDEDQSLPKLKSLEGDASIKEKFAFMEGAEAMGKEIISRGFKKVKHETF
jgi:hypothetical protein